MREEGGGVVVVVMSVVMSWQMTRPGDLSYTATRTVSKIIGMVTLQDYVV
jgi:hypothetical protein